LYGMLIAPIRSKLMLVGIELGVFNHLSGPKTADTVAAAIGSHPENTRLFLDGLAACDLVTKKDGMYQNTIVAQEFLVEGSQTFMGPMLTITAQTFFAIDDLPKLVRNGPPPPTPEADIASGEIWTQYAAAMANAERAGIARQAPEIISGLLEFPTLTKMLDLGGGPGLIGIAILAAHPNMSGTIFDKPAMVKIAETAIKEYGMEDRMDVLGGDFIHDPIGEGYDLIWASSSLSLAKDDMDSLIAKIYDSLSPGGVFVVLHEGLTHERTGPDAMVISMTPLALTGQDMRFDQGFIADSMLRVGFGSVRSRTLETDWGPMDLDIGRKE
ncbi:MAG: methyltransferase, partial [Euryarchaeota archaeon]|nr:methyltransferase [Euryarchaeota archaeon]